VDGSNLIPPLLEGRAAGPPRRKADLALRGPAAIENGNVLGHDMLLELQPAPVNQPGVNKVIRNYFRERPTRLISHSSSTPDVSRTRRRTSSPRSSMAAAEAEPWLIRKLQCISET